MQADNMRSSRVVAMALVVGTFFVAQEVLMDLAGGRPVSIANDVGVVLVFWIVWAVLTPVVLAAIRRWPLDAGPGSHPLLVHAVVAAALSAAHTIITFGFRSAIRYFGDGMTLQEALRRNSLTAFVWGVFTGVCFYAVVVMVYTALRFRALYTAEQLSGARLEGELTRSKLDSLRSQLRPHFLFNTLNAISVFTIEDPGKAQQMILKLSSLLRRSLDEEADEISLGQELGFAADYLDIQRGRFGEQLSVNVAVDRTVMDARVPVFLLQPLLENAIEHGKADGRRTTIELSARRERDTLHIRLTDDGPGIGESAAVREGIGLGNIRARLNHLYGARAIVNLRSASGAAGSPGACVEVTIPFNEMPR